MKDVILAKDIIKKLREVLPAELKYIFDNDPATTFTGDEFALEKIEFEATGGYADAIVISQWGIDINLEDGPYQTLLEYNNFADILEKSESDFAPMRREIAMSVEKANQSY